MIEVVQDRAALYVMRPYHSTSSLTAVLKDLKWPILQDRRRAVQLSMLYKIKNDLICTEGIHPSQPAPYTSSPTPRP